MTASAKSKFDIFVCRFREDQEKELTKCTGYQVEVKKAVLALLKVGINKVKADTEERRFRCWMAQELKKAWMRLIKLDETGVIDGKTLSTQLQVDSLITLYECTNGLETTVDPDVEAIVRMVKQRQFTTRPGVRKGSLDRKRELAKTIGAGGGNEPDKWVKLASDIHRNDTSTPYTTKKVGVQSKSPGLPIATNSKKRHINTQNLPNSTPGTGLMPSSGMNKKPALLYDKEKVGSTAPVTGRRTPTPCKQNSRASAIEPPISISNSPLKKRKRPVRRSISTRKMLKELHTNGESASPSKSLVPSPPAPDQHPAPPCRKPMDELINLHQRKKLMLLCDVDETLVSTGTDDHRAAECLWHPKLSKNCLKLDFKDPKVPPGTIFYSMLRPGLREFLTEVSKLYDIVMYSAGTRAYLENLFSKIEPEGPLLRRIISMHDRGVDSLRKVFTAAFPFRDQCVIIDDIATVWTTPEDVYTIPRFSFWERSGGVDDLVKHYETDHELARCLETLQNVHSTYYQCLNEHKPHPSPDIMKSIISSKCRNLTPIPWYPPLPKVREPICLDLLRTGKCVGCPLFHPIPPIGTIQYGQPIILCDRFCAGDCAFNNPPGSQCSYGYHWTENEEQHYRHTGCLPARRILPKEVG